MRPDSWENKQLPANTLQKGFKGHVIAFPNDTVEKTIHLLTPLRDLPDLIQVVFIKNFKDGDDLKEAASKCKCFRIRGKEMIRWARERAKVRDFLNCTRVLLCYFPLPFLRFKPYL